MIQKFKKVIYARILYLSILLNYYCFVNNAKFLGFSNSNKILDIIDRNNYDKTLHKK